MTQPIESIALLPAGFEDLAPLVAEWALSTEQARYQKRLSTALPALRAFYDAIYPRMEAVMGYLADTPVERSAFQSTSARTLFHLALSYFEASHPIELKWKGVDLDNAFLASRIIYQGPSCEED